MFALDLAEGVRAVRRYFDHPRGSRIGRRACARDFQNSAAVLPVQSNRGQPLRGRQIDAVRVVREMRITPALRGRDQYRIPIACDYEAQLETSINDRACDLAV